MGKKEATNKSLGTNFKLLICIFIIFILLVALILFGFEHGSYIEDKKEITYRTQSEIDGRIKSVKSLLNYTFFDEDFQNRLLKIGNGADQNDFKKIYEQLTSVVILGGVIKDIWYFPLGEDSELQRQNGIFYSDELIYYIDEGFEKASKLSKEDGYGGGEYFIFTLENKDLKSEISPYCAVGHWVLRTSEQNYFEKIGLSLALLNTAELTDNFREVDGMNGVNMCLCDNENNIYYATPKYDLKNSASNSNFKITTNSTYFGLKTILYFPWYQTAVDFLLYSLTIIVVCGIISLGFLLYIRMDDKRRMQSYNSFISAFQKIEQGQLNCRVESCKNDELNKVAHQFNLMMDSLITLNNKLSEEEKRTFKLELEKDDYVIKYLTTQMNKHFIFNTFGTIRSFITLGRKKESVECINWLCDYLRFTLKSKDHVLVLDEINALDSYLKIQHIRFPKIEVSIHLDDEMTKYKMPQFVLQPLVENSYKHAFDDGIGHINICGKVIEKDKLHFEISDDGNGMNSETVDILNSTIECGEETVGNGNIGLINVKERLKMLSGQSFLKVESVLGEGTTVKIEFLGMVREDD